METVLKARLLVTIEGIITGIKGPIKNLIIPQDTNGAECVFLLNATPSLLSNI